MAIQEWKEFDIIALAKITAVVMAIWGFLYGLIFAAIGGSAMSMYGLGGMGAGLGVLSIIVLPILFGIMGFIGGAIYALIYNVVAKRVGGIKVTV